VLKLVLTFLGKLQLAALKDLEATRKAGHMPIEDLKECEAYRDFAAQFGEVKAEKDLCVRERVCVCAYVCMRVCMHISMYVEFGEAYFCVYTYTMRLGKTDRGAEFLDLPLTVD